MQSDFGPPALRHVIDIAVSPGVVFHAVAHPEGIVASFPLTSVQSDLRIGGRIVLNGIGPGGPFTDSGNIEAFDPPRLFSYAYWSTNHGCLDGPDARVLLTYRIEAAGDGCRLTVEQSNLPSAEYAAAMNQAWPMLLDGPKHHLERSSADVAR